MSKSLVKPIRRALGNFRRKAFKTNSAIWFCSDLGKCPLTIPAGKTEVVYDDLVRAIRYLEEKRAEFPWIYISGELDAARHWGHCYPLILHEGEIAGYIKIGQQRVYIDDFEESIALLNDEAFVCDTFIAPEFRGKGLSRELVARTMEWLRGQGVKYLYCHIPGWNDASLRLFRGLGFHPIVRIRHIRFFSYRYYTCQPEKVLAMGRALVVNAATCERVE